MCSLLNPRSLDNVEQDNACSTSTDAMSIAHKSW